jgi:hypothetical protein
MVKCNMVLMMMVGLRWIVRRARDFKKRIA